ncbi:hypothetical protein [Corynebacterium matruchotii]|uniref:hypothetical protein n=1 Tax=Corynebacterium matruchotii TaxID=43768 RepID=UPI00288B7EC5|nr:hypothetical protein [Corynebacterium matruchotii]
MMSSADLGAGVVSVPLGCGGSLMQIHLHVHADADQDCTIDIDLVTTEEGIQIRLRGAQPVDDGVLDVLPDASIADATAVSDVDDPIDIAVDDLLKRWDDECNGDDDGAAAGEAAQGDSYPAPKPLPQDDATHVYLGKLFDWTIAERVEDGVVFTRGDRELFRVPEERFEEMRQLFVLEDTGLITMHVDGFRVVREGWDACIFDGDIFFEAIPASKFATLTRLFT